MFTRKQTARTIIQGAQFGVLCTNRALHSGGAGPPNCRFIFYFYLIYLGAVHEQSPSQRWCGSSELQVEGEGIRVKGLGSRV